MPKITISDYAQTSEYQSVAASLERIAAIAKRGRGKPDFAQILNEVQYAAERVYQLNVRYNQLADRHDKALDAVDDLLQIWKDNRDVLTDERLKFERSAREPADRGE